MLRAALVLALALAPYVVFASDAGPPCSTGEFNCQVHLAVGGPGTLRVSWVCEMIQRLDGVGTRARCVSSSPRAVSWWAEVSECARLSFSPKVSAGNISTVVPIVEWGFSDAVPMAYSSNATSVGCDDQMIGESGGSDCACFFPCGQGNLLSLRHVHAALRRPPDLAGVGGPRSNSPLRTQPAP